MLMKSKSIASILHLAGGLAVGGMSGLRRLVGVRFRFGLTTAGRPEVLFEILARLVMSNIYVACTYVSQIKTRTLFVP